jgi:LacI family transcriptional regulator
MVDRRQKAVYDEKNREEGRQLSVTIKQIADLCGVSRGTVDRVLNKRGKVHPSTQELIEKTIAQLNYTPNIAGKALAARKRPLTIGVVLSSEGNPFFDDVIRGIVQAQQELRDFGVRVKIRKLKGYVPSEQLHQINMLREEGMDGLILHPIFDPAIEQKIRELKEQNIFTVTVNTDIPESARLCYIGSDYEKGGAMAAGMVSLIMQGRARLGIVKGADNILGHQQRLEGFLRRLKDGAENSITVVDYAKAQDDNIIAYESTRSMLEKNRDINALYVVGAGIAGVCRALISLDLKSRVAVVGFDSVPDTVEMMKKGIVRAVICQHPFTQGYRAVRTAYDYLVGGVQPAPDYCLVQNEIMILESL